MKFNLLLVFTMCWAFTFGQKEEPPVVVQQTMLAKYPGAKKVKWEKEDASHWECDFTWEGINYEVTYDQKGNRVETERQLTESEIPEKYKHALSEQFPDYKIVEAWWVETVEGIFYEFDLKGKQGSVEVMMNHKCEVIDDKDEEEETDDD